jgi:hypothetical protein
MNLPNPAVRAPIRGSSGPVLQGACLPCPDIRDPLTLAGGAMARFSHQCPVPNARFLARFKEFVHRKVREEFVPLAPDTDIDHKAWLWSRPYTEKEKQDKWRAWIAASESMDGPLKHRAFKMFMKEETYTGYKHGRAINGPHDVFKVGLGPYITLAEEQLWAKPQFIKKIPVHLRPDFIKQRFGHLSGGHFFDSDYSYFEASFDQIVKEAAEFEFFSYLWSELPDFEAINDKFQNWSSGGNVKTANKHFWIKLNSVRMSGESTTSSGNGFTNWMVSEFLAHVNNAQIVGIYEGDDALCWFSKNPPTARQYAALGFDIKLTFHDDLSTTSFCGQVFDFHDSAVLADPKYILAGLGWVPSRYVNSAHSTKMSLLRAKAWSYGYQYQATPIISAMARAYLRLTKSFDVRKAYGSLDMYKRELLQQAVAVGRPELDKQIGMGTRHLMFKLYGVDIPTQLKYESYFDSLKTIEPIPLWFDVPPEWTHCWANYVMEVPTYMMNIPPVEWAPAHPVNVPHIPEAKDPRMQSYIDARLKTT